MQKLKNVRLIVMVLCCLIGLKVSASEPLSENKPTGNVSSSDKPLRPVAAAYTFEAGSSSVTDTYLSPSTFRGWHLGLGYERLQAMAFNPEKWIMQLVGRVSADRGFNRSNTLGVWSGDVNLSWGMMYRFAPFYGITVAVGPRLTADVGIIYADRAGNNPVSAKAAITLDVTAMATWSTRLRSLPVTLRYQPSLALLGAFFSPDYDELYYEIYLGNRHHLAHCATPFNRLLLTNYVTADLRFSSSNLRLGFRSTILSSKANHLTTNWFTCQAVIGVSGEWLSVPAVRRMSEDTRIISAIY